MKIFLFLIFLNLVGCSYSSFYKTEEFKESENFKSKTVEFKDVKLYSSIPNKKMQVIGPIVTCCSSNQDDTINLMKNAAMLGANAVIDVKINNFSSLNNFFSISGVAVYIYEE